MVRNPAVPRPKAPPPKGVGRNPYVSDRVFAPLTGANANHFRNVRYKNLAITDPARAGGGLNGFNRAVQHVVAANHLHLYLGEEIHNVFGTAVKFCMAFLPAKTLRFNNSQALKPDFMQRIFNFIQLEGLDDGFNFFHRSRPIIGAAPKPLLAVTRPRLLARHMACVLGGRQSRRGKKIAFLGKGGLFYVQNAYNLTTTKGRLAPCRIPPHKPNSRLARTGHRIFSIRARQMKPQNELLSGIGTTIFTVMSALANQHGAVNLGQGFPDYDGPADVIHAAAAALLDGRNQYPPMSGVPELRQAVAHHNKRFYGIEADPNTEVVVTSGATEAITACLMAVLNPGDECVLIEPLYDTYLPVVRLLGAVPKLVRLSPRNGRCRVRNWPRLSAPRPRRFC